MLKRDQETKIVDYIKVIFDKKWLILGTIIVSISFVFILNISKKQYRGFSILEIGNMYFFEEGMSKIFIPVTTTELKEKINQRVYDDLISKEVNIKKISRITVVTGQEGSNIIKIYVTANDPIEGKKYLKKLEEAVVFDSNEKLSKNENYLKSEIEKGINKLSIIETNPNIKDLQFLYSEILAQINKNENALNNIRLARVLKSEQGEKLPFDRTTMLLMIIVGLFFGLIIGVFISFIVDFWQQNKKEILGK